MVSKLFIPVIVMFCSLDSVTSMSMAFFFCSLEVLRITYSSNRIENTTTKPNFQLKSIIRVQLMAGMKNAATEGRANSRNRMVLAMLV